MLVEKPVGLDAGEAAQIGAAAAGAGVFCMEAMWSLFLPRLDVVRQLLADGVVGEPRVVLADMGEWFDDGHRIMRADLAGGPMLDLGTYPVTLATWVLGAPDEVVAAGTPAPNGINGQLAIGLTTASGAAASLFVTMLADTPSAASITGDLGRIDLGGPFYRPGPVALSLRDGTDLRWDEPAGRPRRPALRGRRGGPPDQRPARPGHPCGRGPTPWRPSRSWTGRGPRPASTSPRRWRHERRPS